MDETQSVHAEEGGAVAGATRSVARSSIVFVLRMLPRIKAAKFFRPKVVKKGEHQTRFQKICEMGANTAAGVALFTGYGLALETNSALLEAETEDENRAETALWKIGLAGGIGGVLHSVIGVPLTLAYAHVSHSTTGFKTGLNCPSNIGRISLSPQFKQLSVINRVKAYVNDVYRGCSTQIIKDAIGFGLFFSVYEGTYRYLTYGLEGRRLYSLRGDNDVVKHHQQHSNHSVAFRALTAGGMAGMAFHIVGYPCDMAVDILKQEARKRNKKRSKKVGIPLTTATTTSESTSTIKQSGKMQRPANQNLDQFSSQPRARDVFRFLQDPTSRRGEIFHGFWKAAARSIPISAVTFLAYELTLQYMAGSTEPEHLLEHLRSKMG